jgi:DNA-binding response OmpR family regulator
MIVEDNTDVIHYLESILYPEYSIRIATNGKEALELAFEIIPDIIISDVMMPVMDGFILCEKLKTDERTSHIPVILLTAMASDIKKMEGLETGADDYIIKPFNDKELKVRTRNLIEQRRKLREYFSRNLSISPKDIAVTSADEKFMIRAMDIIEKSMSNPEFGVNIFGKEIGMSHSQLYRKIHALTNFTPVELIRIMRLKRAASLLKQKYGNISEVAYETGFSSPSYFSDCFQKQFGKSPTEFIENN